MKEKTKRRSKNSEKIGRSSISLRMNAELCRNCYPFPPPGHFFPFPLLSSHSSNRSPFSSHLPHLSTLHSSAHPLSFSFCYSYFLFFSFLVSYFCLSYYSYFYFSYFSRLPNFLVILPSCVSFPLPFHCLVLSTSLFVILFASSIVILLLIPLYLSLYFFFFSFYPPM